MHITEGIFPLREVLMEANKYLMFETFGFYKGLLSGFFSRRSDPDPVFLVGWIRVKLNHIRNPCSGTESG